jgi:uncharacterized protein (DUF58 family)
MSPERTGDRTSGTTWIRPTRRAVVVLTLGFAAALLPAVVAARLWTVWPAFLGTLVLAAVWDVLSGPSARRIRIREELPECLYIGDPDPIVLRLRGDGRAAPVEVRLDLGDRFEEADPIHTRLAPDGETVVARVRPRRRGPAVVEAIWLRWAGPFGLVCRVHRRLVNREIPVVPDVRSVRNAALLSFRSPERWMGLKEARHVGEGSEFESLREYLPGFDHRTIDWKASARHRKLLVREHRAERDQPVIVALDTGHLMCESIDGVPRLDRAINAGLHLAMVALKTGDRVGMFAFDEKVRAYHEPVGGIGSFHRLQRFCANVDYSAGETNFTLGMLDLTSRLRRRSLVILLTDFVDTVTAELMVENMDRVARRHLVLCVTLRDPLPDRLTSARPRTLGTVHRAVVAHDLAREREVVLRRLRRRGVHCIDARPASVTTPLLNRYLEIKRRELVG